MDHWRGWRPAVGRGPVRSRPLPPCSSPHIARSWEPPENPLLTCPLVGVARASCWVLSVSVPGPTMAVWNVVAAHQAVGFPADHPMAWSPGAGAHVLPADADRGQGRVGGGRRGAGAHDRAGLFWPGCLRPPRRPALPDQRDLAGRCRRAAPVVRARRGLRAASVCRLSIASWSRRQHASRGHRPLPVVRRYCASGGGRVRSERQPGRVAGSLPRLVPRWRRSRPPALRRHRTGLAYRVNPRAGWSQVRIGTSRQTPGASARPLLTT